MSARWLTVLLLLAAGCGSQLDPQAGTAESADAAVTSEVAQVTAPTPVTTEVAPSTVAAKVTASTTPGVIYKQVQLEASLPPLNGPATLWRVPALPPDPQRLARWARAFGFTDEVIEALDRFARQPPSAGPDTSPPAINSSIGS